MYNSGLLPPTTYGADTWTPTKQAQHELGAAPTKMESSMLTIAYKDLQTRHNLLEGIRIFSVKICINPYPSSMH